MAGEKLTKCIIPGNKVDIRVENTSGFSSEDGLPFKDYRSQVYDVISEDRIELVMPMEKFGMVLLPVGEEYELYFYSTNGMYRCKAEVVEREKRDVLFVLVMDITSDLIRDQRREYYRFSCTLPIETRVLDKNEQINTESHGWKLDFIDLELPVAPNKIVDIGGGGLRFVSESPYEDGETLLCIFQLETDKGIRVFYLPGKVLGVRKNINRTDLYEHRIKYLHISNSERDDIMRYIFKEERKQRK